MEYTNNENKSFLLWKEQILEILSKNDVLSYA